MINALRSIAGSPKQNSILIDVIESYLFTPLLFFLTILVFQILYTYINHTREIEILREQLQKYEKDLTYATSLLDMQNNYLISYSCPNLPPDPPISMVTTIVESALFAPFLFLVTIMTIRLLYICINHSKEVEELKKQIQLYEKELMISNTLNLNRFVNDQLLQCSGTNPCPHVPES